MTDTDTPRTEAGRRLLSAPMLDCDLSHVAITDVAIRAIEAEAEAAGRAAALGVRGTALRVVREARDFEMDGPLLVAIVALDEALRETDV